jgi:hypothetical protein
MFSEWHGQDFHCDWYKLLISRLHTKSYAHTYKLARQTSLDIKVLSWKDSFMTIIYIYFKYNSRPARPSLKEYVITYTYNIHLLPPMRKLTETQFYDT